MKAREDAEIAVSGLGATGAENPRSPRLTGSRLTPERAGSRPCRRAYGLDVSSVSGIWKRESSSGIPVSIVSIVIT